MQKEGNKKASISQYCLMKDLKKYVLQEKNPPS